MNWNLCKIHSTIYFTWIRLNSKNNLLLDGKHENAMKVVQVNDYKKKSQILWKNISKKKVESAQINMTTEYGIKPEMDSSKRST